MSSEGKTVENVGLLLISVTYTKANNVANPPPNECPDVIILTFLFYQGSEFA